tara:strand:+ start:482 stop:967 length:486 start_codon:yes stop_codon:yes gene_type:complete
MSYQKLQGYIAVDVFRSDNANVPFPNIAAEGAATSTSGSKLVDGNANFNKLGIKEGDIVYDTTNSASATVIEVIDDNTLMLNSAIMVSGDTYIIYVANPASGADDANNGCVLYVGVSGNLKVTTIGGSTITFTAMPVGFVPVQVKKVWATDTTAKDIIALW